MGLDTDGNLALLFGEVASVRAVQADMRMTTVMGAPEGSPVYATGLRGMDEVDPDAPASDVIMRLLPDWRKKTDGHAAAREAALWELGEGQEG
jgi:hypothetical protein